MMCNPNQNPSQTNQSSGSRPTGSKSGNVSPWNDPRLDPEINKFVYGTLDDQCRRLGREVARAKNHWLSIQLQRQGLTQEIIDRVNRFEPEAIRFVAGWCAWYGYTHCSPTLNKIMLLKRGKVVAEATLFEMPKLYEISTTTCCP